MSLLRKVSYKKIDKKKLIILYTIRMNYLRYLFDLKNVICFVIVKKVVS